MGTMRFILAVPMMLLAAAQFAAAADETGSRTIAGKQTAEFCVAGYLPYWETKAFDPAIGKSLTDLIYFSIEPSPAGDVNHRDIVPETLELLRSVRKQHGTRIEISIGGWGRAKALGAVAVDKEKRQRFIQALVKYCQDNQLDGVDFDWEFPHGKAEIAAFATLLTECKAALAPEHRLLTIAVSPDQPLPAAAIEAVDRVHLMSYDHDGAEHSTLAQAEADVKQVLARGVPKGKLVLGVPFYGRKPRGSPGQLPYAKIVGNFHPGPNLDSESGYYFNGIDTIRKKTRLARSEGLGGVMIWEAGEDTRDDTSLLQAIHAEAAQK
jgi:chitinase